MIYVDVKRLEIREPCLCCCPVVVVSLLFGGGG